MILHTNGALAAATVPITSSVSIAPQVVVARLTVPGVAMGELIDVDSRIEIQVPHAPNVAVLDLLRFTYDGAVNPLASFSPMGRPMGENVSVTYRKYRVCFIGAKAVVPALPPGVDTVYVDHVVYCASSAWQPGWADAIVMYVDQGATVFPA